MVGNTYVRTPRFPNLPTHAAPAAVQGRGLEKGYQSRICLRNVSRHSFSIRTHFISRTSDAFALNIGRDDWMPARVADAYSAAKALNSKFKLFISFDMACVLSTLLSLKLNLRYAGLSGAQRSKTSPCYSGILPATPRTRTSSSTTESRLCRPLLAKVAPMVAASNQRGVHSREAWVEM